MEREQIVDLLNDRERGLRGLWESVLRDASRAQFRCWVGLLYIYNICMHLSTRLMPAWSQR